MSRIFGLNYTKEQTPSTRLLTFEIEDAIKDAKQWAEKLKDAPPNQKIPGNNWVDKNKLWWLG